MRHLSGELRQAVRLMRRQPGFSAFAVATLAIGIGAATAVFSLVQAVLLRDFPFAAPRLVADLTPEERRVRTECLWVKCESCRTIRRRCVPGSSASPSPSLHGTPTTCRSDIVRSARWPRFR